MRFRYCYLEDKLGFCHYAVIGFSSVSLLQDFLEYNNYKIVNSKVLASKREFYLDNKNLEVPYYNANKLRSL